ncbi:unnamed protein product [Paramecium sonneborni]|uniref:MORN repeat protein n=1 Tax=Paramecium sonneborni TaxID=65129 RepID=A0A8S1RJ54_9CILI|nr:unnamed protein product [Paramecium sonneborni]
MAENQEQPAHFCQTHKDYMYEIVCFDYMTNECGFLCKKCYRLKEKKQKKEQEYQEHHNKFISKLEELKGQLKKYKDDKIKQIVEKFQQIVTKGLEKICDQFGFAIKQIDMFIEQLKNLNLEQLKNLNLEEQQKKIDKQKVEIQELRKQSIPQKVKALSEIKNELFDEIFKLEDHLFSEPLLGQQLYEIPELEDIFLNFDTNNLLLKFEQDYHKKYQFLGQNDVERMSKEYQDELKNLEEKLQTKELETQSKEINKVLEEQKKNMLKRFQKYQNWIEKILENVKKVRQECIGRDEEIQLMLRKDFINLKQLNIANQKHKNFFEELRETASQICHLGQYDIKISLEKIESSFMVKFIPIKMLYDLNQMQNNLIQKYPNVTQILGAHLNQEGHLQGEAQIVENFGENRINVNIGNLEHQIGCTIQKNQNKSLFNLDLLQFFPQSQNKFNYIKKTYENGDQEYIEENNSWELKEQSDQRWTLVINQNEQNQKKIEFKDLSINQQNEVDQNFKIKIIYSQKKKYEGQINNSFQYSGQGTLTDNETVKSGIWKNGKLEGEGLIIYKGKKIYKGDFVNDMKQGWGLEYIIQDQYYEGQFERDQKHGKGKIIKKQNIDDDDHTLVEDNIKWKNGQPLDGLCQIF